MSNKRRLAYQHKQIEKLKEDVKNLKQEIDALELQNEALTKINDANSKTIACLQAEHDKAINQYSASILEAKEIQARYKSAIESAANASKEYESKIQCLLQRLKNQTR